MKLLFSLLFATIFAVVTPLRFIDLPVTGSDKNAAPLNPGARSDMNPEKKTLLTHQVRLVTSSGGVCGGTLINKDYVITAAHCISGFNYDSIPTVKQMYGAEYIDLYFGLTSFGNLNDASVIKRRALKGDFRTHKSWYPSSNENNDIATIKLSEPVLPVADKISYMSLPTNEICSLNLEGKTVTLTGWGEENLETMALRVSETTVQSGQACVDEFTHAHDRQRYGQWEHYTTCNYQTSTMICITGNNDGLTTCRGDDGGPVAYSSKPLEQYLVGVTSFGSKKCSIASPGGYTNVCAHMSWIKSIIQ